jgi:putative sigma-54 modulation protein
LEPKDEEVAMRIETHGQQIDVTPAMRDYVDSKLARLGRHFDQPLDVRALLSVDKTQHRAEGTVNFPGAAPLHADAQGVDVYAAIDLLADKLDRLLVKHKEKQVDNLRRNESAARSGDFA